MTRRTPSIHMLAAAALALAVAAVPAGMGRAASPAAMTPVRIAFSTWTGYGPLVVAQKQGIFKKHGLNVTITIVEDPSARRAAFQAGDLDGAATTVDTLTRWAAVGTPAVQVFGIDRSVGGDGIVAKKSIKTVKDLKGKTVAVNVGSTSEWFLDYVLEHNGMSVNDIHIQDMPDSSVAGSTFRAGRADVAVTWEPWLTRAEQAPFGHVLVSSKTYPDIIVDVFAFRSDWMKAHMAAAQSFVKAYYEAVNLTMSHPSVAYPVIGKYTGETNKAVAADYTTVKLMDLAASKAYFGTTAKPGPIYAIARQSANFWLRIRKISKLPNFNAIIDPRFMQKM